MTLLQLMLQDGITEVLVEDEAMAQMADIAESETAKATDITVESTDWLNQQLTKPIFKHG